MANFLSRAEKLLGKDKIESFENKVILLDESQNLYFDEMKKVLTRMHDTCKVIVMGHSQQCDWQPDTCRLLQLRVRRACLRLNMERGSAPCHR